MTRNEMEPNIREGHQPESAVDLALAASANPSAADVSRASAPITDTPLADTPVTDKAAAETPTVDTATGHAAPAEFSSERTKRIFAQIAERYDLFNQLSSLGVYRSWLKVVVECAHAMPTTRMLDVAGGTGDVSFQIASATPPASIMLTDFCPEMLQVAQRRLEKGEGGTVPITLREADGQDLPFPAASFDLVTCAYGIRNMPDRMKALSEAYRVLASGGRYVILEFSTPPHAVWRALYHVYLRLVIPTVGGILTGQRANFVYLNDSIRAFPPQETLADYLYDAGFRHVEYRNVSGGIAAIHVAEK